MITKYPQVLPAYFASKNDTRTTLPGPVFNVMLNCKLFIIKYLFRLVDNSVKISTAISTYVENSSIPSYTQYLIAK